MKFTWSVLLMGIIFIGCNKQEKKIDVPVVEAQDEQPKEIEIGDETTTDPESFKMEDAKAFSKLIAKRTDLKTAEDLIKLYYNFPEEELQSSKIVITDSLIEGEKHMITLIHIGLPDDSIQGIKLIMHAERKDGVWTVTEVKRNWKCWEGRGNTAWGLEMCS